MKRTTELANPSHGHWTNTTSTREPTIRPQVGNISYTTKKFIILVTNKPSTSTTTTSRAPTAAQPIAHPTPHPSPRPNKVDKLVIISTPKVTTLALTNPPAIASITVQPTSAKKPFQINLSPTFKPPNPVIPVSIAKEPRPIYNRTISSGTTSSSTTTTTSTSTSTTSTTTTSTSTTTKRPDQETSKFSILAADKVSTITTSEPLLFPTVQPPIQKPTLGNYSESVDPVRTKPLINRENASGLATISGIVGTRQNPVSTKLIESLSGSRIEDIRNRIESHKMSILPKHESTVTNMENLLQSTNSSMVDLTNRILNIRQNSMNHLHGLQVSYHK